MGVVNATFTWSSANAAFNHCSGIVCDKEVTRLPQDRLCTAQMSPARWESGTAIIGLLIFLSATFFFLCQPAFGRRRCPFGGKQRPFGAHK